MKRSSEEINHDIKSLIMSIKAYIQLAGKRITEQKSIDFLKKADIQIDKLTELINEH